MDVQKAIKNVRNVNDYIILTHDVLNKYKTLQIPLNMSTVLALKKICSFEVEYFSKCQETGAAFIIFERMLKFPPSKTWGLLSKELVSLLHYWNEALRKLLITQSSHWWLFLKSLLKFINDIRLKDNSICNLLVKQTVESLLELVTSDRLDLMQKMEVIKCVNLCCIISSREVRFALGKKFNSYFTKLSQLMATCAHFPTQLAIMELLLRWLLHRHEKNARKAAAVNWLPSSLYSQECVRMFEESDFRDFFKDSRNFLNEHNKGNDSITSVICRKLTVGKVPIISDTDRIQSWLDINSSEQCLTVLVDPRILQALGVTNVFSHEVLTLSSENTRSAVLYREAMQVTISITTLNGPQCLSETTSKIFDEERRNVHICITSRVDMRTVDSALRRALGDSYKCSLDSDKPIGSMSLSPQDNTEAGRKFSGSEDETRFSNSYQAPLEKAKLIQKKRKRSGFMSKSEKVSGWNSPSTTSTTSLAQLHEKLAALPRLHNDKEPLSVLALPKLSSVVELSEPENSFGTSTSTFKIRPHGVSRPKISRKSKTSPSDNEEFLIKKCISAEEIGVGDKSTSCLFLATLGSTDESVVNDTLERLENKDTDLAHLLVQEALNKERDFLDSGINTGENGKKTQDDDVNSEAIENTPVIVQTENKKKTVNSNKKEKVPCTVLSKTTSEESNLPTVKESVKPNPISTSDESNTDGIIETPRNYVNVRRKNRGRKDFGEFTTHGSTENQKVLRNRRPSYNIDDIEDFFSQHFNENKDGELVISPTLAKKINQSSSETSESFDKYLISNIDQAVVDLKELLQEEINPDIIDCLNNMVDHVCNEFDKCTEYFDNQNAKLDFIEEVEKQHDIQMNINKDVVAKNKQTAVTKKESQTPKAKSTITLSYKNTVPKKEKVAKKSIAKKAKNKPQLDNSQKFPIPAEDIRTEIPVDKESPILNKEMEENDSDTPLIVPRKRKLYSPKDDENDKEETTKFSNNQTSVTTTQHVSKLTTPEQKTKLHTPKSAAVSYKDIEDDKKKYIRQPRNRKSRYTTEISPRTLKKNELFDHLKNHIEDKNLKLIDKKSSEHDIAVYNYTSDSEDEDFKKKIDIRGRKSTTTVGSNESATTRQGRLINKVNYSESKNSSTDEGTKTKRDRRNRKKSIKRQKATGKGHNIHIVKDLVDERMREAIQQEPATSPIKETPMKDGVEVLIEPQLNNQPVMEVIPEASFEQDDPDIPENKIITKKTTEHILSIKKEKGAKTKREKEIKEPERCKSESPLPALIIEAAPKKIKADNNSITSSNLVKKCNRLIEDGEDFNNDTTQNLLSDNDRINYSPELRDIPVEIEIIEKLDIKSDTANDLETVVLEDVIHDSKREQKRKITRNRDYKTLDKKVRKQKSQKITSNVKEIQDLTSSHQDSSDRSISTVGKCPITAHGDDDESPPSPKTLKQNIQPRNMELEGMSTSMKEYFLQLRTELDENPKRKEKEKFTFKEKKARGFQTTLPTVIEDIINVSNDKYKAQPSPVVSVAPLSDEDFRKWLPSPRSYHSEDCRSNNKTTNIDSSGNQSNVATKKIKKFIPIKDCFTINVTNKEYQDKKDPGNTTRTQSKSPNLSKKLRLDIELGENRKVPGQSIKKRKSMISPINFDTNDDDTVEISENENIITKSTKIFSAQSFEDGAKPSKAYNLRSHSKELSPSNEVPKVKEVSRKRSGLVESPPKKRKIEIQTVEVLSVSAGARSVESVNNWFSTEMSSKTSAGDAHLLYRDTVENILEKLDTTLIEIQQNTSKNFVHMFVEMQEYQKQLEQKRTEIFKETVRKMFRSFMETVETNFVKLNDRCEELNNDLKLNLKRRAAELIKEDCRQKRVMVAILREDVEAAMKRIGKNNN